MTTKAFARWFNFSDRRGVPCAQAGNGQAALDVLDEFRPDLILLDLRMPVMDGWEFVRTYRKLPGPHAPIIAFVAALRAEQERDGSALSACWPSRSTWKTCWSRSSRRASSPTVQAKT